MSKLYDLLSAMCGKIKKPDWNQNDLTAPDYVKNRPFYTCKPVETTILTATYDEQSDNLETNITGTLVVGETYVVEYNGMKYECTAWDDGSGSGACLGNGSLWGIPAGGEEPFVMWCDNGEFDFMLDEFGSCTVTVLGMWAEVHKIEPKYLPIDIRSSLAVPAYDITKFIPIPDSSGTTFGETQRMTQDEFNELGKSLKQSLVFYGKQQITDANANADSFQFYSFSPGAVCSVSMVTGHYDRDAEVLTCDKEVTYYSLQAQS